MGFYPDNLPDVKYESALPEKAFFVATAILAVGFFVKKYIDSAIEITKTRPRIMCLLYLGGAYVFVHVMKTPVAAFGRRSPWGSQQQSPPPAQCLFTSWQLEKSAATSGVLQMVRSSLVLGAAFCLFGPLLVLTPKRKIYVERTIAKAIVRAAHKKETRYTSFIIFCLVSAAQLIVIYSMSLVLSSVFNLPFLDVIGFCICYFLVVIFYLLAFAKTILKLSGRVFGQDPLHYIRNNLDWLETRAYLAVYLVLFGLKVVGSLGVTIYFFHQDILNINKPKTGVDVSNAALPVAIVFFILQIGSILVFAVFLLVEVFRVKKKEEPRPSAREATVEMMQRISVPSDEEPELKEAWTSAPQPRQRAAAAPRQRQRAATAGSDDNVDGNDSEGEEVKESPHALSEEIARDDERSNSHHSSHEEKRDDEEIGQGDESTAVVLPNYYGPTLNDSQAAGLRASDELVSSDTDTANVKGKGDAGIKAKKTPRRGSPADEPVPSSAQFSVEIPANDLDEGALVELCQTDLQTTAMQALQRELRNAFGLANVTGELELVNIEDGSSGYNRALKATLKATGTAIVSVLLLLVQSRKAISNRPLTCTMHLSGGEVSLVIVLGKVQRLA